MYLSHHLRLGSLCSISQEELIGNGAATGGGKLAGGARDRSHAFATACFFDFGKIIKCTPDRETAELVSRAWDKAKTPLALRKQADPAATAAGAASQGGALQLRRVSRPLCGPRPCAGLGRLRG